MPDFDVRTALQQQLQIEWKFATDLILGQIDENTALWSPGESPSYTVHPTSEGWAGDWPDEENDPPMAATIGWILWHIGWWWSDSLSLVKGLGRVAPQEYTWSGGTDEIAGLKGRWDQVLATEDFDQPIQWAMPEPQPFGMIAAWVNFELAKNLSEINQLKMLRAAIS